MKFSGYVLPISLVLGLAVAGGAAAQPQTKLVQDLPKSLVQAIWCSALFFEESYYYDDGSDDMMHYEDLAFDLGPISIRSFWRIMGFGRRRSTKSGLCSMRALKI